MAVNPVNLSNTVTQVTTAMGSGGTVNTIATLNSSMNYVLIQNVGGADLWFSFGGNSPSVGNGFLLKPGSSIEFSDVIPLGGFGVTADLFGSGPKYSYLITFA